MVLTNHSQTWRPEPTARCLSPAERWPLWLSERACSHSTEPVFTEPESRKLCPRITTFQGPVLQGACKLETHVSQSLCSRHLHPQSCVHRAPCFRDLSSREPEHGRPTFPLSSITSSWSSKHFFQVCLVLWLLLGTLDIWAPLSHWDLCHPCWSSGKAS